LDPVRRDDLLAWLRDQVTAAGLPALWVSHRADEVQAVADRVLVLAAGAGPDGAGARVAGDGDALALLARGGAAGADLHDVLDVDGVAVDAEGARGRWGAVTLVLPTPVPASVAARGRGRLLLSPRDPVLLVG